MERDIKARYNDIINDVFISDPDISESVVYTLDNMEDHLNQTINDPLFTKDLVEAYDQMIYTYDLPIEEIEDGFTLAIKRANGNINELKFDNIYVFDNVPELETMQRKIENKLYQYDKKENSILSINKPISSSKLER